MNRTIIATVLALGLGFTAIPANAVIYCKTVGVPKGCVARPVAGVGAPGVGVVPGVGVGAPGVGVVDPGINQPGAAGNVGAPGASATNRNGGVNRVGVRR
jgi:hypothetical protein